MNKSTLPIKYVFNIGILLGFFLIIFGTYILISDKKELFVQCVYRPKGRRINSLNSNIDISKTNKSYELSLSEFEKLLQLNKINTRKNVLSRINNLNRIKTSKNIESIICNNQDC